MAASLSTTGGSHYYGGDYAGACAYWQQALAIFDDIEKRGALSDYDRNYGRADLRSFEKDYCNPPRKSIGGQL